MQTKERREPVRVVVDALKAGKGKQLRIIGNFPASMKDLIERGVTLHKEGSESYFVPGRRVVEELAKEGLIALDQAARVSFGETVVRDPFQVGITFARISEPRREVALLGSDPRDYGV